MTVRPPKTSLFLISLIGFLIGLPLIMGQEGTKPKPQSNEPLKGEFEVQSEVKLFITIPPKFESLIPEGTTSIDVEFIVTNGKTQFKCQRKLEAEKAFETQAIFPIDFSPETQADSFLKLKTYRWRAVVNNQTLVRGRFQYSRNRVLFSP